jgi:hypothetical protein
MAGMGGLGCGAIPGNSIAKAAVDNSGTPKNANNDFQN